MFAKGDASGQPTVALLPWGNVFEDFLDTIGVSLETFCNEMSGGWLFGYVEALQLAGIRPVIIIFSSQVTVPVHRTHKPTGAPISILPASKLFRAVQRLGRLPGVGHLSKTPFYSQLFKNILPYLGTPLIPLIRELRREGCQAILCQEYEYPRFDVSVLAGWMAGIPAFASFQGGAQGRRGLDHLIHSLLLKNSGGLIIGPRSEIGRVRQRYDLPPSKLAQIFNPLDLRLWTPANRAEVRAALQIPPDSRVLVWHGRISIRHKGLDILLAAWEHLCQTRQGRDLRLFLVGTGQDAAELQQHLERKPLQGIHWINQYLHDRAEIRRYLSAGDVYAFASRHEGFPVAPLEAMACGLPVVATEVQGIPDIFEGGEASGGIIVPPEDVTALAEALGRILDDEALGRELGRRARDRIEAAFSLEAVGQQLSHFLFRTNPQERENVYRSPHFSRR